MNKMELKSSKKAKKAIYTSYLDIKVPFYDVDSMQIVWHGNYLKYIEQARCKLLDEIDYNYYGMEDSGFSWPIVDVKLKYIASARFSKVIRVYTYLMEWESRLRFDYEIYDIESERILNKSHSIQVAVEIATEEMQFGSPQILKEKLSAYITE